MLIIRLEGLWVPATLVAGSCIPSTAKREAAVAIYGKSGTEEMVGSTVENGNLQYKVLGMRSVSYDQARGRSGNGSASSELQSSPTAPVPPYPIYFIANSDIESRNEGDYFTHHETLQNGRTHNPPTPRSLLRLDTLTSRKKCRKKIPVTEPWSQTVISSLPIQASELGKASISQARKRISKIHFICDDFESEALQGRNLEIRMMRLIRPSPLLPSPNLDIEEELLATLDGIVYAQMMLQPGFAAERMGMGTGMGEKQTERCWGERAAMGYADVRLAAQRQVDRVPLHRMEVDRMRDRGVGVNGFFVVR